jgi:hypothetical protein
MSSGCNINIVKGATFTLDVTVNDASGVPLNLDGYSGAATLKSSISNTGSLGILNFGLRSGIDGGIRLSMAATGTEALPVTQGVYDVDLYSPFGDISKILWGYANIYPNIGPISSNENTTASVSAGSSSPVTSVAGKIGDVTLFVEDVQGLTEFLSTGVSGVSIITLNASGQYLLNEINTINSITGGFTGQFYPLHTNPSGYLTSISQTGQLTGAFYPLSSNPSSYITAAQTGAFASVVSLAATGASLISLVNALNSWTGLSTGLYYPYSSNPAGYITSLSPTGQLTGTFYPLVANPAGYLTTLSPTGGLTGAFYPLSSNPAGYLTSLSPTGQLTGQFVSRSETGAFASDIELANASGYLQSLISASSAGVAALNGQSGVVNITATGNLTLTASAGVITISGNTGSLTGAFYPLSSNPSNYITSAQTGVFASDIELANATGALTGAFYPRFTNPLSYLVAADLSAYALQSYVNSASGVLRTDIGLLQGWTGASTGLYYPLSSNPAGYLTSLSPTGQLTGAFYPLSANPANYITSAQTGVFASDIELANATGALTGAFYPRNSNPSNYLVAADLSTYATQAYVNSASGALRTDIGLLQGWTGASTGLYYPLSSNPAGYLTTLSPTGQLTGAFVLRTESGAFASDAELLAASGYLQSLISASSAGVAALNGQSGIVNIGVTGNLTITSVSGLITISGNTGDLVNAFYPLQANPSGYVRSTSGNVTVQGGATILNGQLLIGSSGDNAFIQGNLTGTSGIVITSGSGTLGIGLNYNTVKSNLTGTFITGLVAGTSITVANNGDSTWTINSTASGSANTGELTGVFYPLNANPSGYARGVSGVLTVTDSSQIYDGQLLIGSSGDNAFIQGGITAGSGIVIVSGSGRLTIHATATGGGSANTGELTGAFYPLHSNPSGYLPGSWEVMTGTVLNTSKYISSLALTGDATITFSATPPSGSFFSLHVSNSQNTQGAVLTFPNSFSVNRTENVNKVLVPIVAGITPGEVFLTWFYDGIKYHLINEPTTTRASLGDYSLAIGRGAGVASNAGFSVFIGYNAGYAHVDAGQAVAIGYSAGQNALDYAGTYVGFAAGSSARSASNVCVGYQAGADIGGGSVTLGVHAGQNAGGGGSNQYIGYHAGNETTGTNASTFIGERAGAFAKNSSFSTFIGHLAGTNSSGAEKSIFLGNWAGLTGANISNKLWIDTQLWRKTILIFR